MTLKEMYQTKLSVFKKTGFKEEPANLLALLLLPERDQYEVLKIDEGNFYTKYKSKIDCKIKQVEEDFQFTIDEIIMKIESNNIIINDYENDKIWLVFYKGFQALQWGILYHNDWTPEKIYLKYFDVKNS